ncbi:FAD-dependent oxidoreductase [Mycoplasmatota bacterium]|nr:FAD-dependent oxidoreductase [Mycoplasmatota bacterium]
MNNYDVIVIGAGPAGMNAAIYANRAGLNVLMLEKGAPGGQMVNTSEVENYIGFGKLSGADLALKMFNHTQELGVEYRYGEVTEIIDGEIKIVKTTDNEYEGKAIIIATGTVPRSLGAENEEKFAGNGISWCAICDGPLYKDKDVLVIGGGNSAIEEAIYLSGLAKSVKVLARRELRANATYIDKTKKYDNIEIVKNTSVESFIGDGKISGARIINNITKEKSEIKFDGAFIFVGFNPKTNSFKNLGILDDSGYIKTNEFMETRVKGIYAAGDVIVKNLRQIATATNDGAIAAMQAGKYIEDLN